MDNKRQKSKRNQKYKKRNSLKKNQLVKANPSFTNDNSIKKDENNAEWIQSKGRNMLERNIFLNKNNTTNKKKKKRKRQRQQNISSMFGTNGIDLGNTSHNHKSTPSRKKRKRKISKLTLNESARKKQQTTTLDKYMRRVK